MTPMRPYLLRALHNWIVDNACTPHILVNAEAEHVEVPQQYIKDGKIILNISPSAVRNLSIENDWLTFSARFSGSSFSVMVPIEAVMAVYARENGKGMVFQPEEIEPPSPPEPEMEPPRPPRGKPVLRRIK